MANADLLVVMLARFCLSPLLHCDRNDRGAVVQKFLFTFTNL